jgi:hypothetical protein
VLLLAVALASCATAREQPPAPVTLRVLTYNIHHGEGRDGRIDLYRIAEVMSSAEPDLIALQEVDRGTERVGGTDQLTELAGLLGMRAEFGKTIDHAGGDYGVAILSRWPMEGVENRPLPTTPGYEPRTALSARVRAGGQGPWVRFTSTHLDNSRDQEEKLMQAIRLNELLAAGPTSRASWPATSTPGLGPTRSGRSRSAGRSRYRTYRAIRRPTVRPCRRLRRRDRDRGVKVRVKGGQGQRRGPRGDLVLMRPTGAWRVLESRSLDDQGARTTGRSSPSWSGSRRAECERLHQPGGERGRGRPRVHPRAARAAR